MANANKKSSLRIVSDAKVGPIRITPRKVSEIVTLVRAKDVNSAIRILRFSPAKRTAGFISKVIMSAVANATQKNPSLDVDQLVISEILVGAGPTMKRFMPRAKGSASRILKRTSRVSVTLGEYIKSPSNNQSANQAEGK